MKQNVAFGSNVSIVFYVDGQPIALSGEVRETEPFTVWSNGEGAAHLAEGRRAMLVVQSGRDFNKAEAELRAEPSENGWKIVADSFGWESVDRRRYPRFDVQMPIAIRAVLESNEGIELSRLDAVTEDISIGGAWVKSDKTLPSATLVEVTADMGNGGTIRALSLVKWADRQEAGHGFGVEFLDFLDGSRYSLHQFLNKEAA